MNLMRLDAYEEFGGVAYLDHEQHCQKCRRMTASYIVCNDGAVGVECSCGFMQIKPPMGEDNNAPDFKAAEKILRSFISGVLICAVVFAAVAYFLGWYS